jgi:hypothetical protein
MQSDGTAHSWVVVLPEPLDVEAPPEPPELEVEVELPPAPPKPPAAPVPPELLALGAEPLVPEAEPPAAEVA